MTPISFDEFSFFGDIVFEISKRQILEKVKNKNYIKNYFSFCNIAGIIFINLLFHDCN